MIQFDVGYFFPGAPFTRPSDGRSVVLRDLLPPNVPRDIGAARIARQLVQTSGKAPSAGFWRDFDASPAQMKNDASEVPYVNVLLLVVNGTGFDLTLKDQDVTDCVLVGSPAETLQDGAKVVSTNKIPGVPGACPFGLFLTSAFADGYSEGEPRRNSAAFHFTSASPDLPDGLTCGWIRWFTGRHSHWTFLSLQEPKGASALLKANDPRIPTSRFDEPPPFRPETLSCTATLGKHRASMSCAGASRSTALMTVLLEAVGG